MNRTFEEDLDKLRTRLIRMGSLVEEQVEFALRALHEGNLEIAKIVVERDDKVDKLDLKIDKLCQRIFALSQPVASDLRLLLSAIKINNELERIGDVATEIAKIVMKMPAIVALGNELELKHLTSSVFAMLKASLDAFINNDPDLADHILPSDNKIDSLAISMQSVVIERMKSDPSLIDAGSQLLLVSHILERAADHATNIAETVIFLVRAKLVRHPSINTDVDREPDQFEPLPDDESTT